MKLRFTRLLIILAILIVGIYVLNVNYGLMDGITGSTVIKSLTDAITGGSIRGETVIVDLYVMSQCPYGVMAENLFKEVMDKLGDSVYLNIEYIGRRISETEYQSLHGQPEVDGDVIQLCAKKYSPPKYFDFIICQNKNGYQDLKSSVDKCATETGIDVLSINTCFKGEEGKALLAESFKKSEEKQVQGSPTIYIGGTPYNGKRDPASIQKALCKWLNTAECKDMPECSSDEECADKPEMIGKCENPDTKAAKCVYTEPTPIELIVVNDKNCAACDTGNIITALKGIFKGTTVKEVDANSDDGKNLITSLGIKYVPAFVYGKEIADSSAFKANEQLRSAFVPIGDKYKILDEATGASYLIDENEKKKLTAMLNIGGKPQVDFFVMSYCPYGNMAEEALSQVYDVLGDTVKYVPHNVIYSNYRNGGSAYCMDESNKYCSMHGVQEMNQGIREVCVYKTMGIKKYFDFVKAMNAQCTAENADVCWENAAKGIGLDTSAIDSCYVNNGIEYADQDLTLDNALNVRGSPTIFMNGQPYNSGRDASSYQRQLCSMFSPSKKPAGCNVMLAAAQQSAPQGSGCGS